MIAPAADNAGQSAGKRKARISVLTLGVADLERAVHFYRDGLAISFDADIIISRWFHKPCIMLRARLVYQ